MKKVLFIFVGMSCSLLTAQQKTGTLPSSGKAKTADLSNITELETFLIVAPILSSFLLIVFIFRKLSREKYKIGDALKENFAITVSDKNQATQVNNGQAPVADPNKPLTPQNIAETKQPKSSSRLLAFFSGMITIGLVTCLTSFWIYTKITKLNGVEFEDLTNVFLAMGLGIIPYTVNKFSSSTKSN